MDLSSAMRSGGLGSRDDGCHRLRCSRHTGSAPARARARSAVCTVARAARTSRANRAIRETGTPRTTFAPLMRSLTIPTRTTGTCTCAMARRWRPCCRSPRRASRARSSCPISSRRSRPPRRRWPIAHRILAALPAGSDFQPLMTLYLTDRHVAGRSTRARRAASCTDSSSIRLAPPRTPIPASPTSRKLDAVLARMSDDRHDPAGAWRGHRRATSTCSIAKRASSTNSRAARRRAFRSCASCSSTSPRRRAVEFVRSARDAASAPRSRRSICCIESQCPVRRRHPPASLLPAGAEDGAGSRGAARGGHQRRSAILPRHRQRAARPAHQGDALRLRGNVLRARGDRAVRRSLRDAGRAATPRGFASRVRRRLLRAAAQHGRIPLSKTWMVPASYAYVEDGWFRSGRASAPLATERRDEPANPRCPSSRAVSELSSRSSSTRNGRFNCATDALLEIAAVMIEFEPNGTPAPRACASLSCAGIRGLEHRSRPRSR